MRLFGKGIGVLVELNIVSVCFGTMIAYTVALGDLLHPLTNAWLERRTVMLLGWACLMLPLSMLLTVCFLVRLQRAERRLVMKAFALTQNP